MTGYSAYPKAPALLEFHHQIIQCHIQSVDCKDAVSVFYSSSQLGNRKLNTLCGSKYFENRTQLPHWALFSLTIFVKSVVGSVCLNLDFLGIWDLMTTNISQADFTQVLPKQLTSNMYQFCDKVCGSAASLKSHMKVHGLMLFMPMTGHVLVTYVAVLARVKLAFWATCIIMDTFCRTENMFFL